MYLPEPVLACLNALEHAGFAAYAVGGCVRDACLGQQAQDFDLCTAALPEQIQQIFAGHRLVLAGVKHGTVGVVTPMGVIEITTFRSEGDYLDNRHPQWVRFVADIDQDLARRDFTINAMAYAPGRGFADPFGGREDLALKQLRTVGDPARRFGEDALRILRGLRFAARYDLTIHPDTWQAMCAQAPLLDNLARERVFEELCKLLPLLTWQRTVAYGPILAAAIPELKPLLGFDQHNPNHAYDLFTHVAHVVGAVPPELPLRWAALLHDIGKVPTFTLDENGRGHFHGHAAVGAELAEQVLLRLKAPTALRTQVEALIAGHMTRLEPDKIALRRQIRRRGWDQVQAMLALQAADMGGKGTVTPENMAIFHEIQEKLQEIAQDDACLSLKDLAVNGHDLQALGLTGRDIGSTLNRLLDQVVAEQLPNQRQALLEEVRRQKEDT